MPLRHSSLPAVLAACAALGASPAAPAADALVDGFSAPPDSARPLTWWHWINGNVTKDGIKADLTAMKEAGIAGVQLFDAGIYLPAGPVRYGTDDWHEHVQFAIETAAELGLEVSLMNTPGWSASGGPWVTPEQSMKQLVWSELDVPGGTPLAVDLPLPATRENFYRDVAVLAVPADADASNALRSPALQSASAAGGASLGAAAFDGDRATSVALDARTQKLEFVFAQPVTVAQLTLELRDAKPGFNFRGTIETSNDGTTFRETHAFSFGPHAQASAQIVTSFKPTRATHVRLSFSAGLDSKPVAFSIAELALANPPRLADWRLKTKLASGAISRSTASARTAAIPRERILDLTTAADAEGRLATTLPAGRWTVLRFGFTSTGARNHPAVPEGHGLEIDKLDADAVAFQFEQSVGRIIRAAGPRAGTTLTGVLFDSFEAGFQNWTEKFPARFRAACGYDLVPLLPALTGRVIESPAFTECVLHDFRHVVDDGLAKSYFGAMRALAHRQRLVTYAEAQGGPLNPVLINPYVDVVMNEFWHHNRFDARLKLSASTVNILDRKVLAAEAFSARPEEDGWAATLRDLKRPGNDAFAAGVNRCILHTYAHQPFTEAAPGFTLGRYGTRFGRLNTWWRHLRTWTDFLSRSQFLLQQGWRPADVLFLQTEDMGYAYPANEVEAFPEGYDFDIGYPKDLAAMTLRDGALTLPHGPAYRLVVTPRMPWAASVATLRHLRAHVRAGQSLLGEPPTGPAGVRDLEQRREFETLVGEIWGDLDGSAVREKKLGEGMVMRGRTIAEALATIGVSRDLSWDSGTEQRSVKFTHRRTAEADIYFVFNNTADARFIEFAFRTTGRRPEIWDPESGSRGDAAIFSVGEHTVNVPLQLAPHGATFVVFRKALPEKWATRATSGNGGTPPLEMSAGKLYAATGSRISLELSDGTLRELPSVSAMPDLALDGAWQVQFLDGRSAPPEATFPRLQSWSERTEEGIKFYAGTAAYRKRFTLPAGYALSPALVAWLDLGQVADIAEVHINGTRAGTLWAPPMRADITRWLRPGENTLELLVTNTWVNRLIGDERIPVAYGYQPKGISKFTDGRLLALPAWLNAAAGTERNPRHSFSTWKHHDAAAPLLPAGLLGPVRITWRTPVAPELLQ